MLPQFPVAARVKFLLNPLGLYLHIPFCEKRCAYCDFYSAFTSEEMLDKYTVALKREIIKWGGLIDRPIDTIYLGGGTPSLLGDRIAPIMTCVRDNFSVQENAEITVEVNPDTATDNFLCAAKQSGVNRISIGAQSSNDKMLKLLGRKHSSTDTVSAVKRARKAGFSNITLDLMIGLPESSLGTLERDIDFILSLSPSHISAYILKVEPDTALGRCADTLNLPDDDAVAEQYLFMCDKLSLNGFSHYEISNFSKNGFEGKHNMKYWQDQEYIGIGPAAHSFYRDRRFYYPCDLHGFIKGNDVVYDGSGGDKSERLMLGLRLKKGIDLTDIYSKVPDEIIARAEQLEVAGLINYSYPHVSLTDKGMLLSNSVILELSI